MALHMSTASESALMENFSTHGQVVSSKRDIRISSMNDLYTTDPRIFGTSREFLSFIQAFGHHTGRHMLELPNDWRGSLLEHFGDAGELERKRILEAVRIAIRRGGLYSAPGQWQATINESWSEMAVRFSRHPKRLKGYICEEETTAKPRMPPEMPVMAYESLLLNRLRRRKFEQRRESTAGFVSRC